MMSRVLGRLFQPFSSHIRYKIILPYAALTFLLVGVLIYFTARTLQDNQEQLYERQLALAGTKFKDSFAQREQLHLTSLRQMRFTQGVADAILERDVQTLAGLISPIAANQGIERVIVVDAEGQRLLELRLRLGSERDYININDPVFLNWTIVERARLGEIEQGFDKFAAILSEEDGLYLMTAASVPAITTGSNTPSANEPPVGAIVVGTNLDMFVREIKERTPADFTIYDSNGEVILSTLVLNPNSTQQLALDPALRQQLQTFSEADVQNPIQQKQVEVNGRDYDFLFSDLRLGLSRAYFSVAFPTKVIVESRGYLQMGLIGAFALALAFVILIGTIAARRITAPIDDLVSTAVAVAEGDYSRRPRVSSGDEIGLLARSLDEMTTSLHARTMALNKRLRELMALHQASAAATSSGLNLDEVISSVAQSMRDALSEVEGVFVYLLDSDDAKFIPVFPRPEVPPDRPTIPQNQNGLLSGRQTSSTSKLLPLAEIDPKGPLGWLRADNINGALLSPLIANQGQVGLMFLVTHQEGGWTEEFLQDSRGLLDTLANQAAIVIRNAQLHEQTEAAYKELQHLDELKGMFIDIAAHELKTPLGAMLPIVSLIKRSIPPEMREDLQILEAAMLRMREIVKSIHAVQQVEAGTTLLKLKNVRIDSIIRSVVSATKTVAALEGQHTIELDLAPELPMIEADPEKVDLILNNLISNAIKFTPANGLIVVKADVSDGHIQISVQDNGVGIGKDEQERIFDRWYQVRPEHRTHGGMGLGLTIVKYMVELHGGKVWLESELGQGATFFFTLPFKPPADRITPPSVKHDLPRRETLAT